VAAAAVLPFISLGVQAANLLIPEVVALYNAIKGLHTAYPQMTQAQLSQLVSELSSQVAAADAAAVAAVADIPPVSGGAVAAAAPASNTPAVAPAAAWAMAMQPQHG